MPTIANCMKFFLRMEKIECLHRPMHLLPRHKRIPLKFGLIKAPKTRQTNCFCDENQFGYAAIIQPLVNRNCVGCHKPGSLGGNIDLSTYSAVKVQVDNGKFLGSVTHTSGYVAMPQGGKLSDCEITQITNWINAGALNN